VALPSDMRFRLMKFAAKVRRHTVGNIQSGMVYGCMRAEMEPSRPSRARCRSGS